MKDNGEYGYESALSDEDRTKGLTAKPLLMVRYLGVKDGLQKIEMREGQSRSVFSCEDPCEFVKVDVLFQNEVISTQRVKNIHGSIIGGALDDAMSGQLEIYKQPSHKSTATTTEQ